MPADKFIAKIDSSSTMLRGAANYLRGKDLSGLAFVPSSRALGALVNAPPKKIRQLVYILGGRKEAVPPEKIPNLRAEEISQWAVNQYSSRRSYPAVLMGSSNGALIHFCAALGIPWLPQTVLVPVRRKKGISADELKGDAEAFVEPAARLLERNPELQVNQMHDPVQDRLMVQQMGYFRVKRLTVGETYERFLKRTLPAGGTIFVSECTFRWPMTKMGERHFFQVGGYGGVGPREYLNGSRRISAFLKKQKSKVRRWDTPKADVQKPEAEWGFEPSMLVDLRKIAKRHGWRIRRIVFNDPAAASPMIADLYRWWYEQRGIPSSRVFAESFLLMDPWWCLRTGSIPFWMVFNTGSSAEELKRYIRRRGPFDEVYLTLFANSVRGIDLTSIPDWNVILRKARKNSAFIGVDETSYPYDLGLYFRFHLDLKNRISARLPMPDPLTLRQLDRFLSSQKTGRRVRWLR